MPKLTVQDMAERVMDHAEKHYADGWDVVVECYSVPDIVEEIERFRTWYDTCHTLAQVMEHFSFKAEVHAERYADARNRSF